MTKSSDSEGRKKVMTKHHIIPSSRRTKERSIPLGYERGDLERKFIELVGERNRPEAMAWIVENCWGGNWHFVEEALAMKDGSLISEFEYKELTVRIDHEIHMRYHLVFKNMVPREIVIFIAVYLWNWGWHFVEEALRIQLNSTISSLAS